jgi:hypothetical protein
VLIGISFGVLTFIIGAGMYSLLHLRELRRLPDSWSFWVLEGILAPGFNGLTVSHILTSSVEFITVALASLTSFIIAGLYTGHEPSFEVGRRVSPTALHHLFFVVMQSFYIVVASVVTARLIFPQLPL